MAENAIPQQKQHQMQRFQLQHLLRIFARQVVFQQPLTLEEVAGYCNLSPTYFSRKFRLITGQTFKEHVNYIRLRQATQMLLMTDNSITKIAMLCGFGSSNYFKDLFRASTGRSPREYRKHSGLPIHPHLRDNG